MNFGRRCERTKSVMTKYGRQTRCAKFSDGFGDDGMSGFGDDFGQGDKSSIAGPLIGGGVAQIGTLATKLLFRGKKIEKFGALIGLGLGGGLSAALAVSPRFRATGISGLITAGLVTLPRLLEDMIGPKTGLKDGFGVHTAERELAGVTTEEMAGAEEMLGADIQLLDSGGGGGVQGVITTEQEMGGANEAQLFGAQQDLTLLGAQQNAPVDLLGGAGFGSNFLSAQ